MTQHIIRDAQEHFGEEVRSIRVQSGRERHALNTRTREVRYAFFPQDFGVVHTMPTVQEPLDHAVAIPNIDTEPEEAILPAAFEDVEVEEEDMEPLETSLESLDEGQDDEEEDEEADFFKLDDPVEDVDEDEEDNLFEEEDEED
jgi:hypothetical protein